MNAFNEEKLIQFAKNVANTVSIRYNTLHGVVHFFQLLGGFVSHWLIPRTAQDGCSVISIINRSACCIVRKGGDAVVLETHGIRTKQKRTALVMQNEDLKPAAKR